MKRASKARELLLLAVNILLVAGWVGFGYWCTGWQRTEPPAFHSSWSQQQRADLLEIDNAMRYNAWFNVLAAHAAELGGPRMDEREASLLWSSSLWLGWRCRRFAGPARRALHEVMATGRGDVYTESGIPVAYFALWLHKVQLVKALVERGCDPNTPYVAWIAADCIDAPGTPVVGNLLVDALHSEYFEMQNSLLSPATRLELLDFLEQHGADIQLIPCARNAALNALLPCLGSESDGGATYAWLVKRGLKLNEADLQNHAKFLQEVGATATLEDLRSQRLLPLPLE